MESVIYPEFWQGSLKRFELLKSSAHLVIGCIYFCGDADTVDSNGLVISKNGVIYVATDKDMAVKFGSFDSETDLEDLHKKIKETNNRLFILENKVYEVENPERHTFTQVFSESGEVQKLFSLSSGGSVIINVVASVYNKTWNDTLYYSSVPYLQEGCFFTNYHTDFIECRKTSTIPDFVGIYAKNNTNSPSLTVTLEVVMLNGKITWYDGELAEDKLSKNCDMVSATINLGSATNLQTNSEMELINDAGEAVSSLENDILYTINASASNGMFIVPNRSDYQNTQLYCFGDGTAELGEKTLDYENGNIILINGNEMSIQENVRDYYTKEETDALIAGKGGNDLNLENGSPVGSVRTKNANNTTESTGLYSAIFGRENTVAGTQAFCAGYGNKITAGNAQAFGMWNEVKNAREVAFGTANVSTQSSNADQQTALSVGNGTSETSRSNAFEVKKSGLVIPGKSGSISENDGSLVTGGIVWDALQAFTPSTTQEQSDWNETDSTKVSYIKNKPNLSNYVSCLNTDQVIFGNKTFATYSFKIADASNTNKIGFSTQLTSWKETDGTQKSQKPYMLIDGAVCASGTNAVADGADLLVNGNDVYQFKNKYLNGLSTPTEYSKLTLNEIYNISFTGSSYVLRIPGTVTDGSAHIKIFVNITSGQTLNIWQGESILPDKQYAFKKKCIVEFKYDGSWEYYVEGVEGGGEENIMHLTGDESCSDYKSFSSGGIKIKNGNSEIGVLGTSCAGDISFYNTKVQEGQMVEIPTRGAVSNFAGGHEVPYTELTISEDGTEATTPQRFSAGALAYKISRVAITKLNLSELDAGFVFGKTIISNYKNSILNVSGIYNEILLGEYRPEASTSTAVFPFDYNSAKPGIKVNFAFKKSFQEVRVYMANTTGAGYYTSSLNTNDSFTNTEAGVVYSSYLANQNEDTSYNNFIFFVKEEGGSLRKANYEDVMWVKIYAQKNELTIAPFEHAEVTICFENHIGGNSSEVTYKGYTNYSSQYGIKLYSI